jgi:hemoglobin-like flavoprotein
MNAGAQSAQELDLGASESGVLFEVLEVLCAEEQKLTDALYPLFFERRPDARPLFGVHALAEREEMIRETMRSLLALSEHEGFLAANLEALGKSHFEYGVTGDMYADFVGVFVDVAGEGLDEAGRRALHLGLTRITDVMRRAGDEAAARATSRA